MKKFIALILASVMILCTLALVSCGDNPQKTETSDTTSASTAGSSETTKGTDGTTSGSRKETTTTKTAETTDTTKGEETTDSETVLTGKEKHPDFKDVNFGGRTFHFVTQKGWSGGWDCYEIYAEATGSDSMITEAIITRNSVIESLYNCKIKETKSDDTRVLISNDRATGQHNYDLSMRLMFEYGMPAYNIASLDIDLSHSWWNQDFLDTFSFTKNGTKIVHSLSGKFNLIMYDSIITMFADMDIYDRAKASGKTDIDLYQTVKDGKWTVDKMLKLMEAAKVDVNGNSTISYDDGDICGLLINPNTRCQYGLFYGFGLKTVIKNENDEYECIDSNNTDLSRVSSLIDLASSVYKSPALGQTGELKSVQALADGQSLFNVQWLIRLHSDEELENYGIDFSEKRLSVIPFPKYDESQENYGTYVSARGYGIRVPDTVVDLKEISQFLEVFGYHSEKLLYPQYVKSLKTQSLCDEGAGEMLEIVLNSLNFDYGNFEENTGFISRIGEMIISGKNNLSKAAASAAKVANAALENAMNVSYEKMNR